MSGRIKQNPTMSKFAAIKTAVFISLWLMAVVFLSCGGSGGTGGAGGGSGAAIFPPAVFMADNNNDGSVELYASSDDGTSIVQLSETMAPGGNVVDFRVSPDGFWAAYGQALGYHSQAAIDGWEGGVEKGLPLAWHLDRLRQAGFRAVDCFARWDCDALYGGILGNEGEG